MIETLLLLWTMVYGVLATIAILLPEDRIKKPTKSVTMFRVHSLVLMVYAGLMSAYMMGLIE